MPRHTNPRPPRDADADAVQLAALESLRVLVGALGGSARAVEQRTGVTNAQLFVLQQLRAGTALSVNELADRARTQQSTVSTVVSRLVRAGLVRKARAADDGRRAVLSLSPAARRLLRNAPASPTAKLIVALESLSDRDQAMLAMGLRALIRALDLSNQKPAMLFEHEHQRSKLRARRGKPGRPR